MREEGLIRAMSEADLAPVVAVERLCHTRPWSAAQFRQELTHPQAAVDLLWLGEDLAGFLCSRLAAGELEVLNVATAPCFRRQGVAGALLRHVLERGVRQGMEQAFLEVRVGNLPALALYQRLGFREIYRRPRYYPDGEDAVVMKLECRSSRRPAGASLPSWAGKERTEG